MSEVPNVDVNVQSGGKPIINSGLRRTHVAIGYTSAGQFTAREVNYDDLLSTYVSGDLVKAVARVIDRVAANAIVVRRDYTAVASTKSINTDEVDGTSVVAVTGTATEAREFIFTVTSGGTIGSSDVEYTLSTDGGATEVAGTITSPAATLAIGFGLTLEFAVGTLVTGDVVTVSSTDPSPAILSIIKSGSGTLSPTASGTPLETYRGRIEFLNAGIIGVDGIRYRLSLDGGTTWQPTASLGTATSIVITDLRDDGTTTPTGVTVSFTGSQTVDVDTVVTFRTTAPRVAIADVLLAIDEVVGSAYKQRGWRFFHIIGEYTAAEMAQVQTKLSSIQGNKQWTYAFMSFRDKRPYEDEGDWITSVIADRATLSADRVSPAAGYGRSFTCPVTSRLDRRPAAWCDVVRRLCVNENVESGRKLDGPIGGEFRGKVGGETASGDVVLYEDGARVEYDAEVDSRLADARITVLRTFTGQGLGSFVNGSRLGTGPSSNFTRTRDRELNDIASRALDSEGIRNLLQNVRRNPGAYPTDVAAQPGDPGTILESEALNLEREMRTTVLGAVGSLASSVLVTLSRTDNLTGRSGATAVPRRITYTCEIDGQPVIEGVNIEQIFNG